MVEYLKWQINTAIDNDNYARFEFKHRLTYLSKFLISRKISD